MPSKENQKRAHEWCEKNSVDFIVEGWLAEEFDRVALEQHTSEHHCKFTGQGMWDGYNCAIRAALEAKQKVSAASPAWYATEQEYHAHGLKCRDEGRNAASEAKQKVSGAASPVKEGE